MLKKIRIILAAVCFIGITLLFVGIGHGWWGWLAKLQLLPATMRLIGSFTLGNAAVVLGILLITWLFGRIYCSVLCPLGVFQDIVIWLRKTLGKKIKPLHKKFDFNKERRWVRYPVAAAFIGCIIVDLQLVVSLLGPYSAYGRMVRSVVGGGPAPLLIAACITFVVIAVCAWLWGREWCNTVCPVGTVLGCISKYSVFGVRFDENKCLRCGGCAHICKASCIDVSTMTVDRSRCVDCFDCVALCHLGGVKYGLSSATRKLTPEDYGLRPIPPTGKACGPLPLTLRGRRRSPESVSASATESPTNANGLSRRAFIASGVGLIGAGIAAKAQEMKLDGGLAPMEAKTPVEREPRLVPPGAGSVKNFYDRCTACQLCVAACPNRVLRPSTDLNHFLQPQMGYENGFCRPECTACSEVCPAGAIVKVEHDAKTLIHIGTASVDPTLCLAAKGEAGCGKCARECPTGAISMLKVDGVRRPVVAEDQCIGCGKCEYLCPSRPVSAITVKGLETHRI